MDDTEKAQEPQTPRDASSKTSSLPLRRLSVAVVGAAVVVALGVGVALAAPSDGSRPGRGVTSTEPTGDSSGGDVAGSGSTGGLSDGGTTDGGSTAGSTSDGSVAGAADGGSTAGGDDGQPSPTTPPSSPPVDLQELNRRISELDKKVDKLPTKKELADALRAFADQLDHRGSGRPEPDPS
ncbi:hypothetical protein [Streptomyces cyanogenus]|uniref:Uncharacterized protein n=1 Tax=Streptomyces cyanogenus TaxID=80860 RepID=A0ABX7TRL0_STRCY|nr:hypothetical protein [Streptomyces cyanogenus]QTD99362.1 hypothetical protein S1361_18570 [Streptomyces cyanogenus]